jgi:hypothetical protein
LGIRVDAFLPYTCISVGVRILASQPVVFNNEHTSAASGHGNIS